MAIEFLIILLIGLLGSAVFLLFVNNKKAKIITATIVFSLYVILLAIGVFAIGFLTTLASGRQKTYYGHLFHQTLMTLL